MLPVVLRVSNGDVDFDDDDNGSDDDVVTRFSCFLCHL